MQALTIGTSDLISCKCPCDCFCGCLRSSFDNIQTLHVACEDLAAVCSSRAQTISQMTSANASYHFPTTAITADDWVCNGTCHSHRRPCPSHHNFATCKTTASADDGANFYSTLEGLLLQFDLLMILLSSLNLASKSP